MSLDPTKLCQIEITVKNVNRSLRFYENVFGWKKLPAELHEYVVLSVPEGCGFGISLVPQDNLKSKILKFIPTFSRLVPYFRCDDPERIATLAKEFGGKVCFGPKTLASYGVLYQIQDPDGQRFGLMKVNGVSHHL